MNIQEWYLPQDKQKRTALQWELFKYCRPRSIAILGTEGKKDRHINIGQIGEFKKEMKAKFNQENPNWDFYASVEHLAKTSQTTREQFKQDLKEGKSVKELAEEHSTFPQAVENRKEELENNKLDKTVYFPANYKDHWYDFLYEAPAYDLVFDIDGDHLIDNPEQATRQEIVEAAHKEATKIVDFLRGKNAPYYVKFSGNRGFHIGIPRSYIEEYFDSNDYANTGRLFAQYIEDRTDAHVDFNIYKDRQIYRVPYSMHTESQLICMPLTDKQFYNFDLKYAVPDYIRNNIEIKNRGLQTRKGNINRVIKDFREWQEEEGIAQQPDQRKKRKSRSNVDKVVNQFRALSKDEQDEFMQKVKE